MNLENLIADSADNANVPVRLVKAVVQVESNNNPWAVRYEPAFFERYVSGQGHKVYPGCSRDTEERLRACSFGLMQIMGQVAREAGFSGTFLTELCNPEMGLYWGCLHLRKQLDRYSGDEYSAVAAYNAGSARRVSNGRFRNQDYVDKVFKGIF